LFLDYYCYSHRLELFKDELDPIFDEVMAIIRVIQVISVADAFESVCIIVNV
jgi:hypothetical protein